VEQTQCPLITSSAVPADSGTTRRRQAKKSKKSNIHVPTGDIRRVSKSKAERAKIKFDNPSSLFEAKHLDRLQRAMYFEHQAMPANEFLLQVCKSAKRKGCASTEVYAYQQWLDTNSKIKSVVNRTPSRSSSPDQRCRMTTEELSTRISDIMAQEKAGWATRLAAVRGRHA
jgi:hypothetical protein